MFISPGSRAKAGGKPFPTGTQMMFINAAAPLGWVRVATFDDALLRIVGSNTPSSGGTNGFVATVNSQTGTGTGNTGTGSTGTGSTGTGTSGSSSLSTAQLASHTHGSIPLLGSAGSIACSQSLVNTLGGSTAGAGSGATHNHTVPALTIPALTIPALTVPSLSVTFGIKYVDALIARKS